ncbi:MAG: serine hydrolase, partial [Ignavibacteriae bacterium]|nr:serine hydrolase [Ignavibacteriota bacterium]
MFFTITSCSKKSKELDKSNKLSVDVVLSNWLEKTGIPSISYVFIKDGKIEAIGAKGFANLQKEVPVDTATIYSPGSNFKSVTSTAVMQLSEKGLIDLEAPINQYLKNPVAYFDNEHPIKVKDLMSHQSGIPSSFRSRNLWSRHVNDLSFEDIAGIVRPNANPETIYQYANDGYAILGAIIEMVSGMKYEDYVFENILKPLGITTSGFSEPTPDMLENIALPYHMRYNMPFANNFQRSVQYPTGDVYLKPSDMAKFLCMHLNNGIYNGNRVLEEKSVVQMHMPAIKVTDDFSYGYGFGIETIKDKKYSWHQGSLPGYLAVFRMDFETKSAVYLATNVTASPLQEKQLGLLINHLFDYVQGNELSHIMDIPVEERKPAEQPLSLNLDKYVGKYNIEGAPVHLTIDRVGNQLFLINPSQQRFSLAYLDSDRFFITTENEDIDFILVEGQVNKLIFYSGDSKIIAIKQVE